MFRMMNWGFVPLVALAAISATPALAGSYAIEGVSYGSSGLAYGLMLLGAGALVMASCFFLSSRAAILACVAIGIATLMPVFAMAQAVPASPTSALVPWGDLANSAFKVMIEAVLPVLGVAITALAGRLAWWAPMMFTTARVDRALRTGADYAINAVAGATHDKAITVDVGYVVLKVGLERILGSTPGWLIKELGGPKGITERLFRVFKFDETVTDANTLSKVIADLPTFPFVKAV